MLGRSKREFSPIFAAPLYRGVPRLSAFAGARPPRRRRPATLTPELAKLGTAAVAAQPAPAQAEAIGLPAEGPGSLVREGERVIVEARFEAGALARARSAEAAGAKILARQPPSTRRSLSRSNPKTSRRSPQSPASAPSRPRVAPSSTAPKKSSAPPPSQSNGLCEGGSVISQGARAAERPGRPRRLRRARGGGDDRRHLRLLQLGDHLDRRRPDRHQRPRRRSQQRPAGDGEHLQRPAGTGAT